MSSDPQPGDQQFQPDFIVVGSGAGGGPLAARLAERGHQVHLIEAGSDHSDPPGNQANEVSLLPSFHGISTEHDELSWKFFVRHYSNPPGADPKAEPNGTIFYPRAAALGGCTIHNAMITIAGPDSDWDDLADFLGDPSWRGSSMRQYFQRLERNEYTDPPDAIPARWDTVLWHNVRWLFNLPFLGLRAPDYSAGRHGFDGWLHTSIADLSLGLRDRQLIKMLKAALWKAVGAGIDNGWSLARRFLQGRIKEALDPNHARTQEESPEGVVLIPIAVRGKKSSSQVSGAALQVGRRSSPRELLLEVKAKHPQNLIIWTDCLVTKVLFAAPAADQRERAVGVEFRKGARLYRAHPHPATGEFPTHEARVRPGGEVILCGGAFNTPQLLMLSGIGPRAELAKHGIPCRIDAPAVGTNLQDRYEVTVISEMKKPFSLLKGATFAFPSGDASPDPHLSEWRAQGTGLYTSNGAVLGILKRSRPDLGQPDLFIFGIPLPFEGYKVGYSKVGHIHDRFTWAILKGQTNNHDGTVRLRSTDPLDTPEINFHYFNETCRAGGADDDPDLLALLEGVKFVRGIADVAGKFYFQVRNEAHPGREQVPVGNEQAIKDWIKREAWGHHACGTCRMGPDNDLQAVLDTQFRVRHVDGLRVVDASIFPKIPGYFIVTNIYMASEKAADVIHAQHPKPANNGAHVPGPADARANGSPTYPDQLRAKEEEALRCRRKHVDLADVDAGINHRESAVVAQDDAESSRREWADDVTGLGLSGGGIRSATFNLGVLQALARGRALRYIDFLSTVSGGGYIGSFLGRAFDRLRVDAFLGDSSHSAPAPARIEAELTDPTSRSVAWLRKHGNYIAPTGQGDARLNLATFLRNLLSMHFVVGMLVFALFGLGNIVRYGLLDPATAALGLLRLGEGDLPLGHLLEAVLGPFSSPWFMLFELLVLFLVVPRMVGYWLASQDKPRQFDAPSLVLLFLIGSVLLLAGVRDGFASQPIFLALGLFTSLLHVESAWRSGRVREAAVGTGGVETQRLRTRNILTYDLGLALAIAGGLLGFALIDTLAHGLQQWFAHNRTYEAAFAGFIGALATVGPIARFAARLFSGEKKGGATSGLVRQLKGQVMAGLLALLLLTVPMLFYSFASHAVFDGGSAFSAGVVVTLFALAISLVLTHRKAISFVNRSSIAQTYSARLARAYLGASNPLRHRPEGSDVTEVIGGDDVPAMPDYQPYAAGGPLHLLNVTVNQTVDFTSQRGNRDRKGENMAVSGVGISVGSRYHALWGQPAAQAAQPGKKRPTPLIPVGGGPDGEHPLRDESGAGAQCAEMLSLRQWMGLSGAAVSPGSGVNTKVGTALLLGMANLRTGYWWNSSISAAARAGFPQLSFFRRLLYLLPELFRTQALLIFEWIARYPGPWERYWFISDGGYFENLAGYELIRRRVPRIILSDAGADPNYEFSDLADLIRKARIDFSVDIEEWTATERATLPAPLQAHIGSVAELAAPSSKHAALLWANYPPLANGTTQRRSLILYLKASVTGDESRDVSHYHVTHPEFPHESTGDQFFDEPQWESYRELGEHIASPLFENMAWFYAIDR